MEDNKVINGSKGNESKDKDVKLSKNEELLFDLLGDALKELDSKDDSSKNKEDNNKDEGIDSDSEEKKEYVCPICGKKFKNRHALAGHMKIHQKDSLGGNTVSPDEDEEEVEEELLIPPKQQLEQWFISELEKKLKLVIKPKAVELFISFLKDHPEWIWDSWVLSSRLNEICKGSIVNPAGLQLILQDMYAKLQRKKEEMEMVIGAPIHVTITPPGSNPMAMPPYPVSPPMAPNYGYPNMYPNQYPYGQQYPHNPYMQNQYPYPQPYQQPPQYPHQIKESKKEDSKIERLIQILMERLDRLERVKQQEQLVEVPSPDGKGVIRVPVSKLPLYLSKLQEKSKSKDDELVEIPTPYGIPLKVPKDQAPMFMMFMMMMSQNNKKEEKTVQVPNPFGEGMIEVPESQAPIYIMLHNLQKEKEEKKDEKLVEIEFAGTTIKVPASQVPNYMILKKMIEEMEGMQSTLFALLSSSQSKEEDKKEEKKETVKIPTSDGKIIEVPKDEALWYVLLEKEKEKQKMLEEQNKLLVKKLDELSRIVSPENLKKILQHLGVGGQQISPTLLLLSQTREDINKISDRIFTMIEKGVIPPVPPAPFQPQQMPTTVPQPQQIAPQQPITMPKPTYSEEERRRRLEAIKKAIDNQIKNIDNNQPQTKNQNK